jgi:transcriptional regulator with XRE-family HTH domain
MLSKSATLAPTAAGREFPLDDMGAIGKLIHARRSELGLSLRDLSSGTGLSLAFVHAVEHGKATAEIGKVVELLAALGIDLIGRSR